MAQSSTDLCGLLVVDKPLGRSSMDVVRVVRRRAGRAKTGHAGTLDPLATGVVVCCLGKATKAVERLMAMTKVYETTVDLSAFTITDDAEGEREEVAVGEEPSAEAVRRVLDELTGVIDQRPPAYSAIKVGGKRAYKMARKGEVVEIPVRKVRVDRIEVLRYAWPELEIRVTCGKGTYIRSLARQIGEGLGTGGYLTALRRTAVGMYDLSLAVPLEEVPEPLTQEHLLPVPPLEVSDVG